ncbi:hypothetical protein MOKP45_04180 [Mycobacterium avium subsp. hominissuis]
MPPWPTITTAPGSPRAAIASFTSLEMVVKSSAGEVDSGTSDACGVIDAGGASLGEVCTTRPVEEAATRVSKMVARTRTFRTDG